MTRITRKALLLALSIAFAAQATGSTTHGPGVDDDGVPDSGWSAVLDPCMLCPLAEDAAPVAADLREHEATASDQWKRYPQAPRAPPA